MPPSGRSRAAQCAAPTAKTNRSYNRDRSPHPPRFARHLPLKGKAFGRLIAAPTADTEAVSSSRRGRSQTGPREGHTPGWLLSAFGRFTFSPSPAVLKKTFRNWVGEDLGPPVRIRTGSVGSAYSGAVRKLHQQQIWTTQAPSGAGRKRRQALLILRAGTMAAQTRRASPVKRGPGKAVLWT